MTDIYRHSLRVPKEAVDAHGHVNNVRYVQWMQEAAMSHSDDSGCTRLTESLGATWFIRAHRIEYFRPAFVNDDINVITWVADYRKVRCLRKYRFVRASDQAVLADGETDWIFVDADNTRPRVIPAEIREALKAVPEEREPGRTTGGGRNKVKGVVPFDTTMR